LAVEAAELFVTVTADVDKAVRNMNRVNDTTQKSEGFFKGATKQALGFAGGLLAFGAAGAAFSVVKGGAIDMNAELERSTLQFETLMGDSDKARAHVESLFDFAAKTPFETGPIIEASRIMETFGGSALNSKDNLKLFGDAAAATSQPINEVGFWMSRAYADIQAGRPFGEAAMRLAEMGVVTPQVRSKLEDLQKSGAKGSEVWGELTGSLERFDGAMEKQAGTFDGMMSTFMDGVNMLLARALKPLFDGLKMVLAGANELMASPAFNGAMEVVGKGIGDAFSIVADVLGRVWSAVSPLVEALSGLLGIGVQVSGAATSLTEDMEALTEGFFGLATTIQTAMFDAMETVLGMAPQIADAFFEMATKAVDAFIVAAPLFLDGVLNMIQNGINWVINTGVPMAANALAIFAEKFIAWVPGAAEKLGALLPVIAEKIINFIATNTPILIGKLIEWGMAFIGWVAKNVLPRLPGVLATIGGAIIGWIARTTPVIIGRVADMGVKFLGMIGQQLGKVPGAVAGFLGQVVAQVGTWAGTMAARASMAASDFVARLLQFIGQAPGKVMNFLNQLPGMILGWGGRIANGALNAGRTFVSKFINALASLPGKVAQAVRNAFARIKIDIGPFHISASGVSIDLPKIDLPSFAVGAWNIPQDMVAQIHAGEMIVPKDIADRLRGGRGFGGTDSGGGGRGGGDVFVFNIGEFHGTQDNIQSLSESIASHVRLQRARRAVVA
jgi:hypothetical protein